MMTDKLQGIYFGERGILFKDFLKNILKKTGVGKELIDILTEDSSMLIYNNAFTSDSVDMDNNYQILEQIGDLTGNKFISNYMYERFPVLDRTEAVQVVARLRINYGAKESFSEFARSLGFFDFITATNELRKSNMKDLLEDVFEAFLGATERILDRRKRVGVGYAVVYDILATIFDNIEISLRYEDMYDPKTRLKELLEKDKKLYGKEQYRNDRKGNLVHSEVIRIINGAEKVIGVGVASLQTAAEEKAAQMALDNLAKQGISKPLPNIFRIINKEYYKNTEKYIEEIVKSSMILQELEKAQIKLNEYNQKAGLEEKKIDINTNIFIKQKTKHSFRYESTLLASYCKSRSLSGVVECIKLGANPNVPDINGIFPLDLLLIGKIDDEISKIIDILILNQMKYPLKVHKSVFDLYYNKYLVNKDFQKYIEKFEIVKD
jgi:dsRNA-specific ribonuclease